MIKSKEDNFINTRIGFFLLTVCLFWIKTLYGYNADFNLGVQGVYQTIILIINPLATTIFFLGTFLYIKKGRRAYGFLLVVYFILSFLLYANVLYYREYSDFLSVNTIMGVKNVSEGLNGSILALMKPRDVLYWLDFVVLVGLVLTKVIKAKNEMVSRKKGILVSFAGILVFMGNLALAEIDRPQLLSRTFDQGYIVKYLGLNAFTAYDGVKTIQVNQVRANAEGINLEEVREDISNNQVNPSEEYNGIAKGRNVIYLHLESIQQFLMNYKLDGNEVTPFLNSIYNSENTFSFNNFYHQVGQGKSSDAENLIENSLFGLSRGSAFSQLGGINTFQGAPSIMKNNGYTTAAFHSNTGTFWNRNNTYRNLGYDYFFDSSFYDMSSERVTNYGLNDKPFYKDSIEYLKGLPEPFFTKFITVSNHFPYPIVSEEDGTPNFPVPSTEDETVNGYFSTVHYADEAIEEFFNYLKEEGLYENSIIVMYGDHYGISKARTKELAPLLNMDPETMTDFDYAELQKVPFMVHIPGVEGKKVDTIGGQVDVLPTVLNLLGVDTKNYTFVGNDLLSPENKDQVVFRNGDVLSKKYSKIGSKVYNSKTGDLIENLTEKEQNEVDNIELYGRNQLSNSDKILTGDLLRFNKIEGFKEVDKDSINYKKKEQLEKLKKEGKK